MDEIESIVVDLPDHAAEHIGDPPKYDPQTRETADHSLPYMLAVALVDGASRWAPTGPSGSWTRACGR